MKYAELFAGAGGLSRGLEAAGFQCVAHAEIEPHARAVLRYRWPETRLDGDVTAVSGADYDGITLLSGGSPCQDLSVAGKRAGLSGSRSSLFHQQVRIWRESGAPYFLWENVHGAFSSNGGRDFAEVLSTIVGATIPVPADGWRSGGVAAGRDAVAAWRVLDLQHFGPPQRRVRVFVLAARAGGVDPAEILALSEGVCGHPSPRQRTREGSAASTAGGIGTGGVIPYTASRFAQYEEGVGQLRAAGGDLGGGSETILAFDSYNQAASHVTGALSHGESGRPIAITFAPGNLMRRAGANPSDSVVSTLGADTQGDQAPHVLAFHHTQDPISGDVSRSFGARTAGMGVVQTVTGDITHALTHEGADASEDGTGRGTPIVLASGQANAEVGRGMVPTLTQLHEAPIATLPSGRPRRLTPKEAERLMSWPDDWTRYGIDEKGRTYELSDTARYRLCGNGVGSVCVEWIARRLADAIQRQEAPRAAA